ncbi:hypothetical protein [Streptomyces sp. NPDC089919]|uniref:hypothetical protein n=1 Tax=Streptomyces sp. NPDC089919 TaxID=3155188 RepID=UPI0034432FFA
MTAPSRLRLALLTTAAATALLAAAGTSAGTATAAPPDPYTQDPSGGDKSMRSVLSEDGHQRLEGQFRFHPGLVYKNKPQGEWGAETMDPATMAYAPRFEFAYKVYSGRLLGKQLTTQKGKHDVTLDAEIVPEGDRRAPVAQFHEARAGRHHTLRETHAAGKRIACDSGKYQVRWAVTRTGPAGGTVTVRGTLHWDASCTQLRDALQGAR